MKSLPAALAGIVMALVALTVLAGVIAAHATELLALAITLIIAAVLFRRSG